MRPLSCESATDLLPNRIRNEISEIDRMRVDRHLERCAPCRAHSELLGLIGRTRPAVPPGLHARLADAVAVRRAPPRRVGAGFAAAAAVVLALLTGGLLATRVQPFGDGEPAAETDLALTMQAVRPDDPLLAGGPEFARLSVEELATLLAEMDQ